MSQAVFIGPFKEEAYRRRGMFALDVVDAITFERIGRNLKIVVDGLTRPPVVNVTGLYVWLKEDARGLRRITIDPQPLPYEKVELAPEDITELVQAAAAAAEEAGDEPPEPFIKIVQMPPREGEPTPAELTMFRGVVLDSPSNPVPLPDASANLEWQDGSEWKSTDADFPIRSAIGTFITVLRLLPDQFPPLVNGEATVRLRVRSGTEVRFSSPMQLEWETATTAESRFYWHDLYLYP